MREQLAVPLGGGGRRGGKNEVRDVAHPVAAAGVLKVIAGGDDAPVPLAEEDVCLWFYFGQWSVLSEGFVG